MSEREGGRGFEVVCEEGPAAPTTASSAALCRLRRRCLRREKREIEIRGEGGEGARERGERQRVWLRQEEEEEETQTCESIRLLEKKENM